MRLGVSLITLAFAKMVSSVYLGPLHRPLISISTLKNQRLMEGVPLDTIVSLVTSNQGLALKVPTILIPDKVNATHVQEVNIARELLLVALVDYAMKAIYAEKERLYLIRRRVLKLIITILRVESKEFYVLMAII